MCDGLEAAAGAPQSLVYKKAPDRLAVSESLSGSPPLTNVHLHKTCQTGNRQAYSGLFRAPACMRRCASATVIATPLTWFMESEFAVGAFGRAFVQGNPVSMPHRHNTNNIETNELFLLLLIVSACSVFSKHFHSHKAQALQMQPIMNSSRITLRCLQHARHQHMPCMAMCSCNHPAPGNKPCTVMPPHWHVAVQHGTLRCTHEPHQTDRTTSAATPRSRCSCHSKLPI